MHSLPAWPAGQALITGQYPLGSGMTTVGRPGGEPGLQAETPTLAEVLRNPGCATGQFGRNHLGVRSQNLSAVHGFDEFYGNLYHLNTKEEPEQVDYPEDPEFSEKVGGRGVLHTYATDTIDNTVDPLFGVVGKQKIERTAPLTRKGMETVDDEIIRAAVKFVKEANSKHTPVFAFVIKNSVER